MLKLSMKAKQIHRKYGINKMKITFLSYDKNNKISIPSQSMHISISAKSMR